jgi:hypothetical protein
LKVVGSGSRAASQWKHPLITRSGPPLASRGLTPGPLTITSPTSPPGNLRPAGQRYFQRGDHYGDACPARRQPLPPTKACARVLPRLAHGATVLMARARSLSGSLQWIPTDSCYWATGPLSLRPAHGYDSFPPPGAGPCTCRPTSSLQAKPALTAGTIVVDQTFAYRSPCSLYHGGWRRYGHFCYQWESSPNMTWTAIMGLAGEPRARPAYGYHHRRRVSSY